MDFDFEDRRFQIAITVVAVLVMMFFANTEEIFECKAPTKYCVLNTQNLYGIKRSKKIMIAKLIDHISVDRYTESRGRRHSRRTVTLYRLNIVSKTGAVKKVFDDYSYSNYADKKGAEIMECIKKEQYPCKIFR